MKKYMFLMVLTLISCNKKTDEITVVGKNGYSIVSEYAQANSFECETSGTRLDMYLDKDYSLTASSNDQFINSIIVCNGANGLNGQQGPQGQMGPQGLQGDVGPTGPQGLPGLAGPVGPQGPSGPQGLPGIPGVNGTSGATIVLYNSTSCTRITGTSVFMKVQGSNVQFFSSSSCHSSQKLAEVSQGESFWISGNILAVYDDKSVRVITFN